VVLAPVLGLYEVRILRYTLGLLWAVPGRVPGVVR
jgi:hypothetical protein